MKDSILNDTITAISTPIGKSGIGIVRLSGQRALSIADKIFVTSNGLRPSQFPSHTLHYGWIKDIDEVLLTVMRSPRTYTKEDIVEINCHSGIVVLRKILEMVLRQGARLAEPGEFTKRAYLNGRIDLAQAEAVLDIINSQTEQALNAAFGQLKGQLSRRISLLRRNLLEILTQLEASIDFSDQDVTPATTDALLKKMEVTQQEIKGLLDTADKGTILRQGVACVICGRPNVGKSSLLNALLKRDRAIVTPIPGTTRDILEETIDLSGIPLKVVDTAGIIQARNLVEKEAVKRSRKHLKEADIVLLVLDSSQKLTAEDSRIARFAARKRTFVISNKQDLPAKISLAEAQRLLPRSKVLGVSALCGTGLDRLEKELTQLIWQGKAGFYTEALVTNIRHQQSLSRAQRFIKSAIKAEKEGRGAEVVALDIKAALASLDEIIGAAKCEDILERIFSQFCIGK